MTPEQIRWTIDCTRNDLEAGAQLLDQPMPDHIRNKLLVARAELQWALDKLLEALAEAENGPTKHQSIH